MTKNTLSDLNNHLFEQLERLNDEELKDEELMQELERSKAIASIGQTIVKNANLVFRAQQHEDEYGRRERSKMPEMLRLNKNEDT